ncbi:MAG: trigger factor [Gemmatimonadota bacterium]|nr:MAG: trigger factor [Gemmatimonadota bacterium]
MVDIVITQSGEEPGVKHLKVEVPVDMVNAAEKKAANYYAKRVKLPGFRKGKVPQNVIKKKFPEAIQENVIRELVEASWKAALDQEELEPIAEPQVKELKFESGAPLTFQMSVAVKPELELSRVGGFKLTRKIPSVTDAMVSTQLEEMQRQRAPWVPVEEDRPKKGDLASVTITPIENGEPQEGSQYQVVLGEGQALPDIEDQIMQMMPGETADAKVSFPDDFPDESKRGDSRTVRVELHEVKRQELPELTDEFAREVGDFDSLVALQSAVRSDLEAEARREGDAEVRRQLIDQIEAANSFEAPRPMVQRVMSAFAEAYQVPDDQLEKFAAEFAPVAERQVKRDLIVGHIAEKQGLKATEEDLDDRIAEIAKKQGSEPGKVYASLEKAKRLTELERSITDDKVFKYLEEQSTITDQTS